MTKPLRVHSRKDLHEHFRGSTRGSTLVAFASSVFLLVPCGRKPKPKCQDDRWVQLRVLERRRVVTKQ